MKQKALSMEELVLCGMFASLTAAGAFIKISIPVQPFPMHFTLQFFFVLLSGFILGARLGGLGVCTYLAVGLAGVPIFAAGGGPAYLIRPTFGFLLGFAGAAYVTGAIASFLRRNSFGPLLCSAVCGMMVYYVCGMVYFYFISNYVIHMPVTWGIVFINCFLLTVGGDMILCVLASLLAVRLIPMVRRMR